MIRDLIYSSVLTISIMATMATTDSGYYLYLKLVVVSYGIIMTPELLRSLHSENHTDNVSDSYVSLRQSDHHYLSPKKYQASYNNNKVRQLPLVCLRSKSEAIVSPVWSNLINHRI